MEEARRDAGLGSANAKPSNLPTANPTLFTNVMKNVGLSQGDNIALVRRLYELADRMEIDTAIELFAEDASWDEPPEMPDATTRHGKQDIRRGYEVWIDVWDSIDVEIVDLEANGDKVLASLHYTARAGGSDAPIEINQWQVWTIRDGLVKHMKMFIDGAEARQAAGLDTQNTTATEATKQ